MNRCVIKFGGSLFRHAEWAERLEHWRRTPSFPLGGRIWIAGGGEMVNSIRCWGDRFGLTERTAHQFSVDCMRWTAQALARQLGTGPPIVQISSLVARSSLAGSVGLDRVFDVGPWMRTNDRLSATWDATSDSIAADLAAQLGATELILLKSCSPGRRIATWGQAADWGLVDREFPRHARGIRRIRWVDFSHSEFAEWTPV